MKTPNSDPLYVVSSKAACPVCGGQRRERKDCLVCFGSGFKQVDLNNLWWPSAGFLVCGGPSVNKLPFHKLGDRGIVSLGINNVAGHVQTSAWCFSDPQNKFHHGIHTDPKCLTFAPIPKLRKCMNAKMNNGKFRATDIRLMDCPGVFGFNRKTEFDAETFLTTDFAHWGHGGKDPNRPFTLLETMLLGLRLMHYLGCPRVYMIGVDHNMTTEQPYAFNQAKTGRNGRYIKANTMLKELRPVFEKANFHVFNCNPESNCDAFDYIPFNQAFDDCKGCIPPEPIDLSLWYDKHIAEANIQENPTLIGWEDLKKEMSAARENNNTETQSNQKP